MAQINYKLNLDSLRGFYDVGYYDTYPYNNDYGKVLRKTGYAYIDEISWSVYNNRFYFHASGILTSGTVAKIRCTDYPTYSTKAGSATPNGFISQDYEGQDAIYLCDNQYGNDIEAFKNAHKGALLVFELATGKVENALPNRYKK